MTAIEQAAMIYTFSSQAAKAGKTVTYRDVLDYLGYGPGVSGQAIRYGLELAWIACSYMGIPSVTAIIVNQSSGAPSEGYSVEDWERDAQQVFSQDNWHPSDEIDWNYVWYNRVGLSEKHSTRGYWTR